MSSNNSEGLVPERPHERGCRASGREAAGTPTATRACPGSAGRSRRVNMDGGGPLPSAGVGVERLHAPAPPSGAACNVALLSHCGTCCIGVNADTSAVPDPDALVEDRRAGFDEVVAVGSTGASRSFRRAG